MPPRRRRSRRQMQDDDDSEGKESSPEYVPNNDPSSSSSGESSGDDSSDVELRPPPRQRRRLGPAARRPGVSSARAKRQRILEGPKTTKTKIAGDVIRYILSCTVRNTLVRWTELKTLVFEPNKHTAEARSVFELAERKLRDVFGIKLVPVQDSNSPTMWFICVLPEGDEDVDRQLRAELLNTAEELKAPRGLVMAVLACIVLKGGEIAADELRRSLFDELDMSALDGSAAPMKKLMSDLKARKWVEERKGAEDRAMYALGRRAFAEVNPLDVFQFAHKLVTGAEAPADDAQVKRIAADMDEFDRQRAEAKRGKRRGNGGNGGARRR